MVPGSTLMYGSNFISVTEKPRDSRMAPTEAAATPLPREDTTPPVMKMYLVAMLAASYPIEINPAAPGWQRKRKKIHGLPRPPGTLQVLHVPPPPAAARPAPSPRGCPPRASRARP